MFNFNIMSRNFIKYQLSLLLLIIIVLAGCKKGYLDINQSNPNLTQDPPINGLLVSVTSESSLNVFRAGYFTSNYVQYLASSYKASDNDIYENVDRSTLWYNVYNTIQDARNMREIAVEKNASHHIGVAKLMEALNMSVAIDLFGDMPYSKAWNPSDIQPVYDNAEDIFNELLKLIDESIIEFNKANVSLNLEQSSDLIHGGNTKAWIKTAYTLKARLLNRLSKTSKYNSTEILNALANGYSSNSDDAQVTQFNGRSPWNNIAYRNTVLLLDGWLSNQIVNNLNGNTYGVVDPRLPFIASPNIDGIYLGTRSGAGSIGSSTGKLESYLFIDGFYSKSGAPLLIVTFSEAKFIEAEASFATDKSRSYQAYLDGIKANMEKLNVPSSQILSYLSNPIVSVGVGNFNKALIFKEKYIAMILNPESWTDARRFNYQYKNFTLPASSLLPEFIRRVGYPISELTRNKPNVPSVSLLTERLWWDK